MAELSFIFQADYDKVIRLREEISRLEDELRRMQGTGSADEIAKLESRLEECRAQLAATVQGAALLNDQLDRTGNTRAHEVFDRIDGQLKPMNEKLDEGANAAGRLNEKLDDVADTEAPDAVDKLGDELEETNDELDEYAKKAKEASNESEAMAGLFGKLTKTMGGLFALDKIKDFAMEVVNVRGKYQQLGMAFENMLGSKERADALTQQLIQTAAITPFSMDDVANGAKQLMAFGVEAENVNDLLIRLGDIAAGTGANVGQLTYVVGQIKAGGRMYGNDLMQFINAGVPIIDALAKTMNVAQSEVKDLISAGKVGFPEVEKAIKSLTDEGSKFGGMMEQASHSVTGQISTLQDNIEQMMNKIGESTDGIMNNALEVLSNLVANYEKVGKVLAGVIATYGTYKAAVMTAAAIDKIKLLTTEGKTIAEVLHAKALAVTEKAQALLNKTMLNNPYVLLATAIAAVVAGYLAFRDSADEVSEAQKKLNKIKEDAAAKLADEKAKIDTLIDAAKNEKLSLEERQRAINELNKIIPEYNAQLDETTGKYIENKQALDKYLNSLQRQYEIEGAKDAFKELGKQVAEANIKVTRAQKEFNEVNKRVASKRAARNNSGSNAFVPMTAQGAVDYMDEGGILNERREILNQAKEEKAELEAQQKELRKLYGEDWQKGAVTPEPEPTGGDGKKTGKKKDTSAEDAKRLAEKQKQIREQLNKDLESLVQQNIDNRLSMQEDGSEKEIELAKNAHKKRYHAIQEQEDEWKKKNEEGAMEGLTDGLTQQQLDALTEARKLADKELAQAEEKIRTDQAKAELQAMQDYLANYGTFQQQKLAIARAYAEKIKAAQTEGEKLSLGKERDQKIASIDARSLASSIDWSQTFAGVGNVLKGIADETLAKIDKYMATDEFRKLTAEQKKAYADFRQQLISGGAGKLANPFSGDTWQQVANDVKKYQESVKATIEAQEKHSKAVEVLAMAQDSLAAATTDTGKKMAQIAVDAAQKAVENTAQAQTDAESNQQQAQNNLKNSTTAATQGLEQFKKSLQEVASGSLYGFANGITKLIGQFTNNDGLQKGLEGLGSKVGGLIGAILQLIDMIGDDAPKFFEDLLGKVQRVIQGILENLPQIIGSVVKGVAGIVGGVFKGIGSWFGLYSSTEKYAEKRSAELTRSNEALRNSIDALKNSLKDANGAKAVEGYTKAIERQKEVNKNLEDSLDVQMRKYGNHHSNAYYFDISKTSLDSINQLLGTNLRNSWDDFSQLSAEQWKQIRDNNPDAWLEITKNGKYDLSEYFNAVADAGDAVKELTDDMMQNITQTTYSSLRDGFVSALMDMDKSASGFANDFSEYMFKAVLNAKIGDALDDELEAWYKDFARMAEDGLDEVEQDELNRRWNNMVQRGLDIRNAAAEATGYTGNGSSQSASRGEYTAMSQDTGTEISGRLTAIQEGQIRAESQRENAYQSIVTMSGSLADLASKQGDMYNVADETRSILAQSYIELQEINDNTSRTATYLKGMQSDLQDIKRKL